MQNHSSAFNLIDRIVCLDVGGRGVAGLFEPARASIGGGSLTEAAARHLMSLQAGDHVFVDESQRFTKDRRK